LALFWQLSIQSRIFLCPVLIILITNSVFGYDFYWWHKGTFLLAVLFAVYLTFKENNFQFSGFILKFFVAAIILLQILGTLFGLGTDFRSSIPYSNSKSAASFVQELCTESCTLVTDNSVFSSSISAYLGARSIYSLPDKEFVTYKKWRSVNGEVTWDALLREMNMYPDALAVISTLDLKEKPRDLKILKEFSPSIWGDNYTILSTDKE
jgi:hypothetical protein